MDNLSSVFLNTILYENEFQNPQIFQQTIGLFLEHSTLALLLHAARSDTVDHYKE
jgi:hypothetical protein